MRSIEAEECECVFDDITEYEGEKTFKNMLNWLRQRIGRVTGESIYYLDLTSDDLGVPVVYGVAPGLESSAREEAFMPGRRLTEAIRQAS